MAGGARCVACDGRGDAVVHGCPAKVVTPDVWDAIDAAEFARHGALPAAGGTNNQTSVGRDAIRAIWDEEDATRRLLGLDNHHGG